MSTDSIHDSIEQATASVGPVWPVHSFVTANPLAGFEDRPFHEAVEQAATTLGGSGYPDRAVFRAAWEDGRIDADRLRTELDAHGYDETPSESLARMARARDDTRTQTPTDRVNRLLTKWLSRFLDEGRAEWPMPDREAGFYGAFRETAQYDGEIPDADRLADLPDEPAAAIERLLADEPRDRWDELFESHFAALPGWSGFVRRRAHERDDWQTTYPITLAGYLAVRLALTDLLDAPLDPGADVADSDGVPRAECWLSAWEATYRETLVDAVRDGAEGATDDHRPDAQFVFCIDTRSEVLRRHLETQGDYETHGYAGFFGVPVRYRGYDAEVAVDACPPIVDAQHYVADRPVDDHDHERADRWLSLRHAGEHVVHALKENAATAFNFVETTGPGYGAALATRTLAPARVHDLLDRVTDRIPDAHEFCEPTLDGEGVTDGPLPRGLTVDEQVEYAASAFELMGWETFARLVVFTGHASETANNPFDSSLDCGACAGNPGGPNARVLAAICNDERVRERLRERGFDIPSETVFLAAEHNTTTDEVELLVDEVPGSHREDVEQLCADLAAARAGATSERASSLDSGDTRATDGVRETERRAADWAETRPEWGLAGNAAFVVGPRDLTADLDLDGRAFLHSYDWRTDDGGDALAAILSGPMVVTQWINSQYYFATTDPAVYGSGSKVTHNPVGNVGVYQGNGGDLATGLPLQSVMASDETPYHQPLRLSVLVHAPVERVTDVLRDHEDVKSLLDNGWLSLTVVDPTREDAHHYEGDLSWSGLDEPARVPDRSPVAADD